MTKTKFSTQDLCMTGLFTAVIAVLAQISVMMPWGVPLTMQTFAIMLAAIVLGAKRSTAATLVYLLLGAAGAPVLANFTGGLQFFAGPTGGFLISFPAMAYVIGKGAEKSGAGKGILAAALASGVILNYLCGIVFFCFVMKADVWAGFTACALPFIPTDILKMALAGVLGVQVRKRLARAL